MGIIGKILSKFSTGTAIQNLENFDMVVEMNDGGILLPIITSQHLDNSQDVIDLLRTKVKNYVEMTELDEFKKDFPNREYLQIELNCIDKPNQVILEELESFRIKYAKQVIKFSWRK